ncbi:MAG: nucleotidyltransferase domain-containing protein [Planctomycetota bacterium]
MDLPAIQNMVDQIVAAVRPLRVVLFGSHARGEAQPGSDVDLLVIQETDLPRPKRSVPLYSLLRAYPCSKDILVYTPREVEADRGLPHSLVMTAIREGKVLYEK